MNSTSNDSVDFLDVAAATATVAGCLATLAALIGVIMHRNASFCAALINFICCCRKRSNRVASSLHLRRAGGALAELGGVVVHPENIYIEPVELITPPERETLARDATAPAPADQPSGRGEPPLVGQQSPDVPGVPQAPASPAQGGHSSGVNDHSGRLGSLLDPLMSKDEIAPVFNLITPQQHIELELMRPPPAGRAKKMQVRADSFKL